MSTDSAVREYTAEARSSGTFGRVICRARDHYFVIDGPPWNGCPGEALTPGEAFLASVAACGVELVEVIAREDGLEAVDVDVSIQGIVDRDRPVREDLTVFNRVEMRFSVDGASGEQARDLVDRMTRRCPLYGSIAASAGEIAVDVRAG